MFVCNRINLNKEKPKDTAFPIKPGKRPNTDSDNEVAIYLGGRSYGSTENLYDNITLNIIPEPNSVMLITLTLASFMLIRRSTNS